MSSSLSLSISINPKYKPDTENYVSLLKKDSDYNTILTKLKTSKYSKTLNISNFKHIRRNNVRGDNTVNDYISKVEKHDENTIVKEYILLYDKLQYDNIYKKNNNNEDIQKYLENIANEIFMQEKAYALIKNSPNWDKRVAIPYISNYESTYDDKYISIKIYMEYLPISTPVDITWANTINDIFTYLEENGIYHLDTHPGNMYITSENKLAIIDFGESRMYIPGFPKPVNIRDKGFPKGVFTKEPINTNKAKLFNSWLNNETHLYDKFGGKNKKRKTKKHRKKRKTQKPKIKYQI